MKTRAVKAPINLAPTLWCSLGAPVSPSSPDPILRPWSQPRRPETLSKSIADSQKLGSPVRSQAVPLVQPTPLLMLLLLVLRIISISKKVESVSSISALENPSATVSTNWGECIKMLPHVHHALAAREARRTWHFQPSHKGRPLIKLHKVGEFPHHWKGLKF